MALVATLDPLSSIEHDVLCLLDLALDEALDRTGSKNLIFLLDTISALRSSTRDSFYTEIDDCTTNLDSFVIPRNQWSALSN